MFDSVTATGQEVAAPMPGDEILAEPDVTMDRAFSVAAAPEAVWPWLVQLGKRRAGWYLPRRVERAVPPARRATRRIEPRWQGLDVGDVIPDYGGRSETFTVVEIAVGENVVYTSRRGHTDVTWAISLAPEPGGTRVRLRLRLHPVKRRWLVQSAGEWFDAATIAGMAAGLRERLEEDF